MRFRLTMPEFVGDLIRRFLYNRIERRLTTKPDTIIGPENNPYLLRWYIIPHNRWLNIYLHEFHRSDDDRALHDHPWPSLSFALKGSIWEIDACGYWNMILPGDIVLRSPRFAHRLQMRIGSSIMAPHGVVTLFITGPKVRDWGFHCPQGWRHWREFTSPESIGEVGKGCD